MRLAPRPRARRAAASSAPGSAKPSRGCGPASIGRVGAVTNVSGRDGAFSRPALAITTAM